MAIITIELNDLVADTIVKKIDQIGTGAKFASAYVSDLSNAIKSLDGKGLSALSQSLSSLASQVKKANESHKELSSSIEKSNKIYTQNQIQISKVAEAKAKEELMNNRLFLSEIKVAEAKDRTSIRRQKELDDLKKISLANLRGNASQLIATAPEISAKGANELKRLNDEFKGITVNGQKAGDSLLTFSNIFKAYVAIRGANEIIKIVDAYTLMENRLKLVSTSQENATSLQNQMFTIANSSRVAVSELTQSFVRYDYALKGLGASQSESIRFTKTLTEQLAISGLTTMEQSSAMLQLSQALNKGKLDGDEFRTVMETLPTLATAIAKQMGVARGELIALAPEGKITAKVIREAMASIANDTDKAFQNLTPTIGQALTVVGNKVIELSGQFNQMTGLSGAVAESIIFLTKNTYLLGEALVIVSGIYATRFIPTILAGITTVSRAGLLLLANPIFTIPALFATGFAVLLKKNNDINDALDADNEKKRIIYEELRKSQQKYVEVVNDETKGTEKLSKATSDYIKLLTNLKALSAKGDLLPVEVEQRKADSEFGKRQKDIDDLIKYKDASLKTDREIQSEKRELLDETFNKQIADSFTTTTLIEKQRQQAYKESSVAINELIAERKRLELEYNTAVANAVTENTEVRKNEYIKQKRDALGFFNFIYSDEFLLKDKSIFNNENDISKTDLTGITKKKGNLENIQREIDLKSELALTNDSLLNKEYENIKKINEAHKKRVEQLEKEGILKVKTSIKNDINKEADEYNNTLTATRELQDELIINESQALLIMRETSRVKKEISLSDSVYSFEFHTESERKINDIKKQRDAIILLMEANKKATDEKFGTGTTQRSVDNLTAEAKKKLDEINRSDTIKGQFGTVGSDLDGSKAYTQAIEAQRVAYEEQVQNAKNRDKEILAEARKRGDSEAEIHRIAGEQEKAVNEANIEKKRQLDNEYASAQLALGANTAGALAGLAEKFAEGHSKRAHIAFEISKGLAYAEAVLNMASAISKANAESSIYTKGLAIGSAIAIGATQIATIASTDAKFAKGGLVRGKGSGTSDEIPAWLSNNEFVMTSKATSKYRNQLEAMNNESSSSSSGSGSSFIANTPASSNGTSSAGVNVNVYNTAGVSVETKTTKNDDGSQNIDLIISKIDAKLAQNYSQNLGQLTSAVKGNIARKY